MHKSSQSHEYFHISFFCKLQPSLPYHLAQKDPKGCLLLWHFHWSSQATCQCSPACRRLTIGVSVVVKLLAFSLGLQRQNHNFLSKGIALIPPLSKHDTKTTTWLDIQRRPSESTWIQHLQRQSGGRTNRKGALCGHLMWWWNCFSPICECELHL